MNPLGRLIKETADARGMSLREVSIRAGWTNSPGRAQQLVSNGIKHISADQLRDLARSLELPLTVLVQAALQTVGLPVQAVSTGQEVADAIANAVDMDADHKRYLLALYNEMINSRQDKWRTRYAAEQRGARRATSS